jgi:integrase
MSSIHKMANGRWKARYRDPLGRSRSRSFLRKDDARRFLAGVDHDKLAGTFVDPRAGRILFATWVKDWRIGVVDLRPSTLARDVGYLERYILPVFGNRRLGEIDHTDVRAWIAELNARGLAPATVAKAGQILGKVMATAVRAGKIPASPCIGVKLPRVEMEEMTFLSPAEVGALAASIDLRFRALVLLGSYGGLRIGEMLGLRAERVDILRGRVDVAENLVEVAGRLYFGPPKTKAGRRVVPIPRVVCTALEEHLKSCAAAPTDLIFRSPEGGPVRLATWRRRFWAPAVHSAGVEPLRPHDLRHTAVALWIAAGAAPKEIAVRAGHSSVVTVLDRYGHLLPGCYRRNSLRTTVVFSARIFADRVDSAASLKTA